MSIIAIAIPIMSVFIFYLSISIYPLIYFSVVGGVCQTT